MATILQRGKKKTWYIKYYVNGRQVYRSLKTDNARVAQQAMRVIEGEDACGHLLAPSKTPLPAFLEDFCRFLGTTRTHKSYSGDASLLRIFFGPICPPLELGSCVNKSRKSVRPHRIQDTMTDVHVKARFLEEITTGCIEQFLASRILKHGISPKTANRFREILHRLFKYAAKNWRYVSPDRGNPNPAAAVERRHEPAPVITWLTREQIDEQLKLVKDWPTMRAMIAMYIYAGLRREEGLWLTMADVDLDNRLIHVRAKTVDSQFWQPKTKCNRVVPISLALAEILSKYTPKREGPWYFPSSRGLRWDLDNFSQDLREINREAGLEWSCLDFRHTFGSHLAQKGESLLKIATLMGNSPEICRKHYAALVPEQMHDTVEFAKLPEPGGPPDRSSGAVIRHLLEKIEQMETERRQSQPARPLRIAR